jgi:hypothetical protein
MDEISGSLKVDGMELTEETKKLTRENERL